MKDKPDPTVRMHLDGKELSTFWIEFYMIDGDTIAVGSGPERYANNIDYLHERLDTRSPYVLFACPEGFLSIPLDKVKYCLADPLPPEPEKEDEDEEEEGEA